MRPEAEDTKMPISDVSAKPIGIVNNCDQKASFGLPANLAKSGSLTINATYTLAIRLIILRLRDGRQTGEVGDGRHDALHESPGPLSTGFGSGLANYGADPSRTDHRPDEESNASDGDNERLDGEQVADLVDGEPDGWEGKEPEEEEGHKVRGVCA